MNSICVCRSEALQVGDVIIGINGIKTNNLTHAEVADTLLNAGPVVSLQLEFDSTQEREYKPYGYVQYMILLRSTT